MRIALPCLTCLLLAAPAAFAQTAPPPGMGDVRPPAGGAPTRRHPPLRELDVNGDGMISRAEAQVRPGLARHFDQIDSNHDGQLDRTELRAWHQQMKAQHQEGQTSPAGEPTVPPPPAENSSTGGLR